MSSSNHATADAVSADRIRATEHIIRPYVRTTPVVEIAGSDLDLPCERLWLKLELCQHTGSFKPRGAFANLLTRAVPEAGVVAASGGNHGVAVAYAAHTLRRSARVFVPSVASPAKMAKIRSLGAHLEVVGERYAEALEASRAWQARSGALEIHAYDSVETLLGQGSLGVELERQVPALDTILIAVGGGGLIGGVAAWFADRVARGDLKIIGVEPETAPTLKLALDAGEPVDSPAGGIAADSLAPKRVGQLMFPIAQQSVDRVVLVEDEAIREAQRTLWDRLRIVAEPGGAAALAALLSRRYTPARHERVAVIVCGANTIAVNFDAA
jgi:threonine dehydratase